MRLEQVSVEFSLLTVEDYNLKRKIMTGFKSRRGTARKRLIALHDINLELNESDRLRIVGNNGAGKTTLLRVICGSLAPSRGFVKTVGRVLPLLGDAGATLDGTLTGRENIYQLGLMLGERPKSLESLVDEIICFSGLGQRIDTAVGTYSSGMAARLRFSVITALKPDILVVDEGIVSTADLEFAERAKERLQQFQNEIPIVIWSSFTQAFSTVVSKQIELHPSEVLT